MKGSKVASRYALALLDISEEQKCTDLVLKNMNTLFSISDGNKDFEMFLKNPIVKSDKKIQIFEKLFSDFNDLTLSFIRLLTKKGRENILAEIAYEFEAQVKKSRGVVPIVLTSAVALDKGLKDNILKKLSNQVTGKLEVEEKIDENLIGGFQVRYGDVQIDASILRQIKEMKKSLMQ
jgi:F-type H+-transporting ATPase subunit delta